MKVKELVAYLQTLDQEAEMLVADYYYGDREGFANFDVDNLGAHIMAPQASRYHQYYAEKGNFYLVDLSSII